VQLLFHVRIQHHQRTCWQLRKLQKISTLKKYNQLSQPSVTCTIVRTPPFPLCIFYEFTDTPLSRPHLTYCEFETSLKEIMNSHLSNEKNDIAEWTCRSENRLGEYVSAILLMFGLKSSKNWVSTSYLLWTRLASSDQHVMWNLLWTVSLKAFKGKLRVHKFEL
jgi:hypothetical protein